MPEPEAIRDRLQETSWKNFFCVSDGPINGNGLMPFCNAAVEFLAARNQFFDASSAALKKKAKKLGAAI